MDKRSEPRVAHRLKFIASIHECLDDPGLVDESIECESIDFTSRSLQLQTDKALVPDTLLDIAITIGEPETKYQLRGEIRWTKIIDNNCHMGVLFLEEKGTDLDVWVTDFDHMFDV